MSLCLTCGLCCDGTMFPAGPVTPEEAARFEGVLDFSADGTKLLLGCRALDGCRCTIYGGERPGICSQFKCLMLSSLEAGKLTEAEAKEGIAELMSRRAAVAELVGIDEPRRALRVAREQVAAGTASEEVKRALQRLTRLTLLMTLPP